MAALDPPAFDIISDEEFKNGFIHIISRGSKDNTYKFALARFLLDYCRENSEPHVDFATVAGRFLEYYWTQVCKLKIKHAPQARKRPEIVRIIEAEFTEPYYPQTFREVAREEPEKVARCVDRITRLCFHNVIWRFQRIRVGRATEARLFFDYRIERTVNSNKKYVDLDYGINLNPRAMDFMRRYDAVLFKSVILEWARFLENLNIGLPKIILKTEGRNVVRGPLAKYRRILYPLFPRCFYCNEELPAGRGTHVEHVIPFDYVAEDDIWNLTLACQRCNCEKLGALPPKKYIDKLVERNREYRGRIPGLERSLDRLDRDFEEVVGGHYRNAISHGYVALKGFGCSGRDAKK